MQTPLLNLVSLLQADVKVAQEVKDVTRIERIGIVLILHLSRCPLLVLFVGIGFDRLQFSRRNLRHSFTHSRSGFGRLLLGASGLARFGRTISRS